MICNMDAYGSIYFNPKRDEPAPKEEERMEATKEQAKKKEQDQQKLDQLVAKSERILYRISTVFPFHLFPDELIIDENKVSLYDKQFFWSESIQSIRIKDIADIIIDTNPFFASITITEMSPRSNPIQLSFLWKKEAFKAHRIIQGLIVACKEEIDLSPIEDILLLLQKLENLGKSGH